MGSLNHCGKDSRFQVHQDCTGHVAPSSGFVEVDINAFLEQTILAGGKGIQRIHIHYQIDHQQVQVDFWARLTVEALSSSIIGNRSAGY